jgi:uncharacterized membrane protein YdjX (TVP38/TMEM64 family)
MTAPTEPTLEPARDVRRRWLRLAALAVMVVTLVVVAKVSGFTSHLGTEEIRARIAAAGWWGPVAFIAAFSLGELAHVPGTVFVLAAVVAYGRVAGGALAFAGALISFSFSFTVVRSVGGQPLGAIRWAFVRRILSQLDDHPIRTVILLRTVLWMTPQVNYALALSRVRPRDFLVGSAVGLFAPMVALVFLLDRFAYLLDRFLLWWG